MKTIWKRHGMTGCGTKALGFVLSLVCSGCILGVSLSGAAPFFDNTGDGFSPRVMVQGREGCFLAADGFNKRKAAVSMQGRRGLPESMGNPVAATGTEVLGKCLSASPGI